MTRGGHHQRPGQFWCRGTRATPAADHDAASRCGSHIDLAAQRPGQADQLDRRRQALDQGTIETRSLTDQNNRINALKSRGNRLRIDQRVMENVDLVTGEPLDAIKAFDRILIVVKDGNSHDRAAHSSAFTPAALISLAQRS